MSDNQDFDLIVIGAGSGGVRLARMSAQRGARVAIVESRYLGGTCVNVGCVPKKLFVYGSHVGEDLEDAAGYGWNVPLDQVSFDWPTLVANKNTEIERLNGIYGRLLENAGVTIIEGTATLADANTVVVGEQRYTTGHITIATGSWPVIPDIPGKESILTSNEMFYLPQLPRQAVVWGGGVISPWSLQAYWRGLVSKPPCYTEESCSCAGLMMTFVNLLPMKCVGKGWM